MISPTPESGYSKVNTGFKIVGGIIKNMKKIFNVKVLMGFIFLTFIASLIYTAVRIYSAPANAPGFGITVRIKGDYVKLFLQCIVGILAMLLPRLLTRKHGLNIPSALIVIYVLFLYGSIYLGGVRDFYDKVPHWDTMLHLSSGAALSVVGFSIAGLLHQSKSDQFPLNPLFAAIFAFCFAITLGVIWEIYEFTMDCFLDGNLQRYALKGGEPFVGQAALMDTMIDLIADAIGAFVVSAVGYFSLKHKKGCVERLLIKRSSCGSRV